MLALGVCECSQDKMKVKWELNERMYSKFTWVTQRTGKQQDNWIPSFWFPRLHQNSSWLMMMPVCLVLEPVENHERVHIEPRVHIEMWIYPWTSVAALLWSTLPFFSFWETKMAAQPLKAGSCMWPSKKVVLIWNKPVSWGQDWWRRSLNVLPISGRINLPLGVGFRVKGVCIKDQRLRNL